MIKKVLILGGVLVAAGAVYWGLFTPSEPEMPLASKDLVAPAKSSSMPTMASSNMTGRQLFEENCAACHGQNAQGTENGPPFLNRIYLPGHHSDMAFAFAAQNGVRSHHWNFGNMPKIEGVGEEEALKIAGYIRKLQRTVGLK